MNRLVIALLTITVFSTSIFGQDAKKALKNASKEASKYSQDPIGKKESLQITLDELKVAFASEEVSANPDSWITKGKVYNEIADAEMKQKLINPEYSFMLPSAAFDAFEAFKKAMSIATKKYHTKDALEEMVSTENHMNNMGITQFQEQKYKEAFTSFKSALEANKLLTDNGFKTRLAEPAAFDDQYFFTAVAGYYGKVGADALPFLMHLYDKGTDKPLVYEALYSVKFEMGDENAVKYLEEGRSKFPAETSLLFAEINHYLKLNKLDALIDKLKLAAQAEPDNMSIVVTLGNVYDQLTAKEREAGNKEKAQEYFDAAYDAYSTVVAKTPEDFDANYSLGALYYNKAASYVSDLNALSQDYSPAATKRYKALQAEMIGQFEKALPFFQKAESLNAKDINTLIALKEIYARKGDLPTSNSYKAKIESIQAGN